MHDASIVVGHTTRVHLTVAVSVEVSLVAWYDVVPFDDNVIVSIWS